MPRRPEFPEYAACEQCDEYAAAALRKIRKRVLCANCAERDTYGDTRHRTRRCAICGRIAPSELHHVASERQHPTLTLCVCLNCHRILSVRQYRWHPAWRTEAHPVRYIIQGVLDVVTLWLQRSPAAEQCRELFALLGRAALCLLPCLRPESLCEVGYLTQWS